MNRPEWKWILDNGRTLPRHAAGQEPFELSGADRVLELADGLGFDLADAPAGDLEDAGRTQKTGTQKTDAENGTGTFLLYAENGTQKTGRALMAST